MTLKRTAIAVAVALGCAALPLGANAQVWHAHHAVGRASARGHDRTLVAARRYDGGPRGGARYRAAPVVRFRYDPGRWHGGYWNHGWHDGQFAWWWVVDGFWFDYPGPIYPYPAYAYQEPVYVTPPDYQTQPGYQPPPPPSAAASYWYYCDNPRGYYPYVSTCPSGWREVPSTPPDR
jgi:hypothetical protein